MAKLDFACHGYASYFCMSIMDRYWQPGMSEEDVAKLMSKCFRELETRFIARLGKFTVKIVDKKGVREISL